MQRNVAFKSKEGYKLDGIFTTPDTPGLYPTIIMTHGHTSSKNSSTYTVLEELLLPLGVATLRFDYRAHGDSEGNYPDMTEGGIISDILQAVNYLFDEQSELVDKSHIFLYGSSLSGLPVIAVAAKDDRITHLINRSGVNDFKLHFDKKYDIAKWKKDGAVKTTEKPEYQGLKYGFYEEGLTYDLEKLASQITIPTLVMHGDKDESVELAHSDKFFEALESKDKTYKILKDSDHWYHDHREEMQQTIVDWIKERI